MVKLGMGSKFDRFVKHATSSDFIQSMILKEMKKKQRPLSEMEILDLLNNRCVCPVCEKFILRSQGWTEEIPVGTCESCGFSGVTKSVRQYVEDEDWR